MFSVEQDFQDAQLGRGTRLLTHSEAEALLAHCERLGWAFQSMEAFECVGEKEIARVDHSILGLTQAERNADTPLDFIQIARVRIDKAKTEPNPFLFQVWVDLPDAILAKRNI